MTRTNLIRSLPETGSVAVYARATRTAQFPAGVWEWDEFIAAEHPLTEQESQELFDSRYRPMLQIIRWQRGK